MELRGHRLSTLRGILTFIPAVALFFVLPDLVAGRWRPWEMQLARGIILGTFLPAAYWIPKLTDRQRNIVITLLGGTASLSVALMTQATGGAASPAFSFLWALPLGIGLLFLETPSSAIAAGVVAVPLGLGFLIGDGRQGTVLFEWVAVTLISTGIAYFTCNLHRRSHRRDLQILEASESLMSRFLGSLPVATFVMDAQGTPLYLNTQATRLLGQGIVPGVPPEGLAEAYKVFVAGTDTLYPTERMPLIRAMAGEATSVTDMEIARPDRRVRLEVAGSPILAADGSVEFAVVTFSDITERHILQTRLATTERLSSLGTLAAGIAHEINNPLSFVLSNLQMLKDEAATGNVTLDSELTGALDDSINGAQRIRTIVRDLKTFSRPDSTDIAPVDVCATLESAITLAWNEIRHRAQLVRDLPESAYVRATPGRLGQVFLNLLVNAAQALPDGRAEENQIRVSVQERDGECCIEVADTGSGIPSELMSHIFEPFFTTKARAGGTGMGLSICHGIVQDLGGRFEVESKPGSGTRMRVILPIAEEATAEAPPTASAVSTSARARVLVIDDEPLVCKAIERMLGAEHDVTVFHEARKALDWIATGNAWDVIVCDLMMPEVTGADVFDELSRLAPHRLDRLLFLTGGAFSQPAQEFLARTSNTKLEKPIDVALLRAAIRAVLVRPAEAKGSADALPPLSGPGWPRRTGVSPS